MTQQSFGIKEQLEKQRDVLWAAVCDLAIFGTCMFWVRLSVCAITFLGIPWQMSKLLNVSLGMGKQSNVK